MKFATEYNATPDGRLLLVSKNNTWVTAADDIAANLQTALQNWDEVYQPLQKRYEELNNGHIIDVKRLETVNLTAPLPRAWQWLDGSCFMSHGDLMQKAFNLAPIADADKYPLVYQGAGDNFSGPKDPIAVPDESYGTDFEGELGVITGSVPMGISANDALNAIKLIVMLNDISYRTLAPREMKTGFGFVQAKGATAFAPIAITPDELGTNWKNGKVHLHLEVQRNGEWFGSPDTAEMHFGFQDIIAHVAATRSLNPGTVVGSGTISNYAPEAGQACIAELRAKQLVANGKPETRFLAPGETVVMQALDKKGNNVFGSITQTAQKVA